jgi:hypothetical protein
LRSRAQVGRCAGAMDSVALDSWLIVEIRLFMAPFSWGKRRVSIGILGVRATTPRKKRS